MDDLPAAVAKYRPLDDVAMAIISHREATLRDALFHSEVKFAVATGRLSEVLSRCDLPAKELRLGRRSILFLGAVRGDPLRASVRLPSRSLDPSRTHNRPKAWLPPSLLAPAQKAFRLLFKRARLRQAVDR
jgi:hypothetical protein